jgi:uncharacterized protein (DUF2236 family)
MASQSDFSKGAGAGTSISAKAITANTSIFPSDSVIWRVTREHVLLLGGPAAAILQIAHPEVALGVAEHSDFRNDSMGRLRRTLDAVYAITFASRAEVEAIAERVRAAHAKVRGDSPQKYSAFSPDAQMWVIATLVQLSVEMFGRFVAPLTKAECESFYCEMRIFGTCFGLNETFGPQTWNEFSIYYREMLASDVLCHLPISRELAHHVAYPRRPRALRLLWPLAGSMAREYLPSPVREKLDLPRTASSRIVASMLETVLPGLVPRLPESLRFAREYLRASR